MEDGNREILSIDALGDDYDCVDLTGDMSTAYGTGFPSYSLQASCNVELYSFEFDNLLKSYPARENNTRDRNQWMFPLNLGHTFRVGNRVSLPVELAHSIVPAKCVRLEKLKAIRRYYDHHQAPVGRICRDAFKLLGSQADDYIPQFVPLSEFEEIPLFPYRMQAVDLWKEAKNWRVLQASAHRDIVTSLAYVDDEEPILGNVSDNVDIFDYSSERAGGNAYGRCSVGVVMETVRTFLGKWIISSSREPVWERGVPATCLVLEVGKTRVHEKLRRFDSVRVRNTQVIWVCQRELQKKVARTWNKDENLPGQAALVMLFILGFPYFLVEDIQDPEINIEEMENEVQDELGSQSSNQDHSMDLGVHELRLWTALAPQDISLMLRLDLRERTVSMTLRNDAGDARFIWQDWVDAAMGYMKGCGRDIMPPELRKPMLELCPFRANEDGTGEVVERTKAVRVWLGWPVFDMRICKFELEQWFDSYNVNPSIDLDPVEQWDVDYKIERAEWEIRTIVWPEDEEIEGSTPCSAV